MKFVETAVLRVGYEEWNGRGRQAVVLVHGWPDSIGTWDRVAPGLAAQGYRVVAPAVRGFAPTAFLDPGTMRSGQLAALGRDLLEFLQALRLDDAVLVGHDWGARAAANACALDSRAARVLVLLSVGYGTNDPRQQLSIRQARNYWYHWYMATSRGERAVHDDRRAFTRTMWETWSPPGWFSEDEFEAAAQAFDNPDWAAVVVHSYRHRWGFESGDPRYDADERAVNPPPTLSVPTLVLHGDADTCTDPETSQGRDGFFDGPYARRLLGGIGHFPQREAPTAVVDHILRFLDGL